MATRNTLAETIDAETAVQIPMSAREQRAAEETDDELSVVDRIRELIQGDAAEKIKIKLYRVNAKNGGFEWCRDLNAYEWQDGDLQMIRDEWGGGVFELRIYGRQGLMGKPRVRIADVPQQNPLALPAPEPQSNNELASVLRMLADGQNRLFAALSEKPDPMASMLTMATAMKAMRDAFGGSDGGGKSSLDQVKELLAVTREVRSATKELSEDTPTPEPENMMGLASKLLGVIGPALTAQQQQQPQMIAAQPVMVPASMQRVENPQPLPTIETTPQPVADDEPLEVFELRQSIELLCKMAAAKQPATKGGQLIYERMPDEMLDHMDSENWFDLVAQVFPIVRAHETWLREAKAEADKLFAADENESEQAKS